MKAYAWWKEINQEKKSNQRRISRAVGIFKTTFPLSYLMAFTSKVLKNGELTYTDAVTNVRGKNAHLYITL